jgi:hypothetical protein
LLIAKIEQILVARFILKYHQHESSEEFFAARSLQLHQIATSHDPVGRAHDCNGYWDGGGDDRKSILILRVG